MCTQYPNKKLQLARDLQAEVGATQVRYGSDGLYPIRYKVHITGLGTDHETVTLSGGQGKAWVAQFVQNATHRARNSSRK